MSSLHFVCSENVCTTLPPLTENCVKNEFLAPLVYLLYFTFDTFFRRLQPCYWFWPTVTRFLDTQMKQHHIRFALLLYSGHVTGFQQIFIINRSLRVLPQGGNGA